MPATLIWRGRPEFDENQLFLVPAANGLVAVQRENYPLPFDLPRLTVAAAQVPGLRQASYVDRNSFLYFTQRNQEGVWQPFKLDPHTGRKVSLDLMGWPTPAGKILQVEMEDGWLSVSTPNDAGAMTSVARRVPFEADLQFFGEEFLAASDTFFACVGPGHDSVFVINFDGRLRSVLMPPLETDPDYGFIEFEQVLIDPWERIWISDGGSKVIVYSPDGDLLYASARNDDFYRHWSNTGWSSIRGIDRQGRLWIAYVGELWIYEIPELALPDLEPSLGKSGESKRTGLEPSL